MHSQTYTFAVVLIAAMPRRQCTGLAGQARPMQLVLLLLAGHHAIAVPDRSEAFHGYSEKGGSTLSGSQTAGKVTTAPSPSPTPSPTIAPGAACRDLLPACLDWASKGECQKNANFMAEKCPAACKLCIPKTPDPAAHRDKMLVLQTSMGDIQIKPLWDAAPKAVALIMDLADQAAGVKGSCRFYRNEAVPADGVGPPYGLFQGSLAGMLQVPGAEPTGTELPTRGAAAMITGTAEFYLSLMDHSSWGSAHLVWGRVLNMDVVDQIVAASPYHNFTHPDYGTVMRMMNKELPFAPVLQPLSSHTTTAETAEL